MREIPGSFSAVLDPSYQPTLALWRRTLLAAGADGNGGGSGPGLYIIISCILVIFSGLMSGLTLGLLSLSSVEVEVLRRSGTDREKRLATKIMPVLKRPHLLLVTLLMCNAAALEALPLFVHKYVSEVVSIIISVTAVLLCGEIIPQAVCSKHGLAIGAATSWLVRGLMLACSPIAWPLSKVLDYFLGKNQTALFRREHLKTLVDLHGTDDGLGGGYLTPDEIKVIRGALDLQIKTARHVLTPLSKVFMLPSDKLLDEATLKLILQSGFSRFLVHEPGDVQRIKGLVLAKELMLIDADDQVCIDALKLRPVPRMAASTPLYDLLRAFKSEGTHMVVLTKPAASSCSVSVDGSTDSSGSGKRKMDRVVVEVSADSASQVATTAGKQVSKSEPAIVPIRVEPESSGPITPLEEAAAIGDAIGIITLEDVVEELLGAEDDVESVRQLSTHHNLPDSPHAHAALPPRLQKVLGRFPMLPGDMAADAAKSGQAPAMQPPTQSQQPSPAPVVAAPTSSKALHLQRAPSIKALPL